MAGIDYTIPQQFKGIQVESPINAMAQAMQLRNLQESSEMNALRRREYQRAREEEEAVRNWFASGKKLDSPEALNELYARAPGAAANIEKSMLERSKTQAEIGYKKAQTGHEDIKARKEQLDFTERALQKSTTPAAAIGHINQAVTLGYLTPDAAEQMKASVPNDPNQFQNWRMNLLAHSLSAKDQLDRLESQQDLAYAAAVTKAVETYAPIPSREAFFGLQPKVAPTAAPTSSVSATTPVPTPDTTVVTRSADVVAPTTAPSTNAAPQPNIEPIVLGESFLDYKNRAILNNRGHIPDQDTYFAEQARLAQQASESAAKATAAPTTTTTTTTAPPPAPGEDRALDPVELISGFKGIDPQAADLYKQALTMKNPDARAQLNKIADEIQKRSQLTGGFLNVLNAEELIDRLEKQTQTPLVKRQIATLRAAIKAENEGRGIRVTATATTSPAGKSLAGPIGERAEKSLVQAEGAAGIMESANMVREALNAGNVIAGPLAGMRTKFAQVLELANAGDKQKLINTRTAIQGLATLTLESRAELRGQGQVTENEQKLLERARSGSIEDMTVAELQQIVNVSQRLASRLWSSHENLLKRMENDPAARDVIRYYRPTVTLPSAVGQSSPQSETDKRNQGLNKIFGGQP